MDFPSRMPTKAALPEIISQSLSIQPKEIFKSRDYMLVYESEQDIKDIQINRQIFDQINLDPGGVIVTARGLKDDFVSRFTPQASILEDPVTGSAHCSLIPFWAERLGKMYLKPHKFQRGGKLYCENLGDRVIISGKARTYSVGTLWTD
jgi:predicted PhzF superfamily epimerase YddE/YHI9